MPSFLMLTVVAACTPETPSKDDPSDHGPTDSGTAPTENTAPTASVTLGPDPVRTNDTLVATPTTNDADGDPLTLTFEWFVSDTSVQSGEGATLAGELFDRGDEVRVELTVDDGTDSATATSAIVTVADSGPSMPTVAIEPTSPADGDDLVCGVSGPSEDADGDAVTYVASWTVDGVAFAGAETTTLAGDTVRAGSTAPAEVWTCTLTPTDGLEDGAPGTASVTVTGLDFVGWPSRNVSLADADYKLVGESRSDEVTYVTGVGDVDGDGLPDLAAAAAGSGAAYVVTSASLGPSPMSLSAAPFRFSGAASTDVLTVSTGPLGDVDGDGLSDLLLVAPGNDAGGDDHGAVYLLPASALAAGRQDVDTVAAATWYGEASGDLDEVGHTGADVDGDGLADVVVTARQSATGGFAAGKVYLFFAGRGLTGGSLSTAPYIFVGEEEVDQAGCSAASAGDVDGDGTDDLLIGALGAKTYKGATYLLLGSGLTGSGTVDLSAADYVFVGEAPGDVSGVQVAGLPDVDGDGRSDVLIGANGRDGIVGGAYVVLAASLGDSRVGLADADHILVGEGAGDRVGFTASSAGDVDADGLTDVLLGSIFRDDGGEDAGAAYLVLAGTLDGAGVFDLGLADHVFTGEAAGDHAGLGGAGPGDLDNDGFDDLLVTAPLQDGAGSDAGAVYVLLTP